MQHLTSNGEFRNSIRTDIPNPFCRKWKDYVELHHPAFIMLSDAQSLKKRGGRRMLLRALLLSAVNLGVDCAFSSPLRRSLRSVNAFYVEARNSEKYILKKVAYHVVVQENTLKT